MPNLTFTALLSCDSIYQRVFVQESSESRLCEKHLTTSIGILQTNADAEKEGSSHQKLKSSEPYLLPWSVERADPQGNHYRHCKWSSRISICGCAVMFLEMFLVFLELVCKEELSDERRTVKNIYIY